MLEYLKIDTAKKLGRPSWRNNCPLGSSTRGLLREGDLVFYNEKVRRTVLHMNSQVFKALLLNNADFIKDELGVIVTEVTEPEVVEPAPEPEVIAEPEDYSTLTKAELSAIALTLGISVPKKATKADIIKLIEEV